MTTSIAEKETSKEIDKSRFSGNVFSWAGINALVFIGTVFTLGIAFPWLVCLKQRYICAHTYINGRKQYFDGSGIQLIGKFVCWLLLTIVTFGIYAFWLELKVRKWIANHTHYVGVKEGVSDFEGGILELIGINIASNFLKIITVGIASFWTHCWQERYYCSHTVIDGQRLKFNGTGGQYFGKKILWCILTVITFGIYAFWLALKSKQWTVLHTVMESPESLVFDAEKCAADDAENIRLEAEKRPAMLLSVQICYDGIVNLLLGVLTRLFFAGDNSIDASPLINAVFLLYDLLGLLINPIVVVILGVMAYRSAKRVNNGQLKLISTLTTSMYSLSYIYTLTNLIIGMF